MGCNSSKAAGTPRPSAVYLSSLCDGGDSTHSSHSPRRTAIDTGPKAPKYRASSPRWQPPCWRPGHPRPVPAPAQGALAPVMTFDFRAMPLCLLFCEENVLFVFFLPWCTVLMPPGICRAVPTPPSSRHTMRSARPTVTSSRILSSALPSTSVPSLTFSHHHNHRDARPLIPHAPTGT